MNKTSKDMEKYEKVAFFFASTISFLTSIYLLWMDSPASASVAGALAITLLLFRFLPIVESFEVLGLKAKLTKQLDEAEELLKKIRASAVVASKLSYVELAWMNRIGGAPLSRQRELLSEIDQLLQSLDVSSEEIESMKSDFIIMIMVDLFHIFKNCVRFRTYDLVRGVEKERKERFGNEAVNSENPDWVRLQEKQRRLNIDGYLKKGAFETLRETGINDVSSNLLNSLELSEDDHQILENVRNTIVELADECQQAGTITPRAEKFLKKYKENQNTLYKELFSAH